MGPQLYRRLIALLPADFRREYGEEMCRVAEESWAEVGAGAGAVRGMYFWARQCASLLGAAVRLRGSSIGRAIPTLGESAHDLRHAARGLVRRPGFTAVTVLTLGLGIGATTAIFSAVNTVLLRSLPYEESDRVAVLFRKDAETGEREEGVSAANIRDFREATTLFESVAVADPWGMDYQVDGRTESLRAWTVSRGFFHAIGAEPALGRVFTDTDYDEGDLSSMVVLSHRSWVNRFGADPSILGRPLALDSDMRSVLGVLRPDFRFPDDAEMWIPRPDQPWDDQSRPAAYMAGVARLADGASFAQGQSEADRIARTLSEQHPRVNSNLGYDVVPLREYLLGDVRTALWVIMGAVGFLLLIACANVAGLMLARGAQRERDFALRGALGAGTGRLVTHVFAESLLLALAGGVIGVLLTYGGIGVIAALGPDHLPRIDELRVDTRVLGFAALVAALSAVLSGLAPTLRLSRPDLRAALGDGARGSTGGRVQARARSRLVVAQVAAAVVLLVGAGLLIRSFGVLLHKDLGFDPSNKLAVQIFAYEYESDGDAQAFVDDAVRSVLAVPGVEGVSLTTNLPSSNDGTIADIYVTLPFQVQGRDPLPTGQEPQTSFVQVGPGYFGLIGTRVVAGREFEDADDRDAARVMIVNETFVRRHLGDLDPLREHVILTPAADGAIPRQIVGVVQDTRPLGHASEPRSEVYLPLRQSWSGSLTLVVQTTREPGAVTLPVMEAIWSANPAQSIWGTSTLEGLLSEWLKERRFTLLLLSGFSVIALVLAAIGLYGLVSFSVERRVGELGIRRALGGRTGDLVGMILGEGARPAAAGLLVGLLAAWYLSRFIEGMLFEVAPTDPLTFGVLALLVLAIAMVATLLPAVRAMRIDPVEALRSE